MNHVLILLTGVTAILAIAWLSTRFLTTRCTSRDVVWRTALVLVALAPIVVAARSAAQEWQWPLAVLPADASDPAKHPDSPLLAPPPLNPRNRVPQLESLMHERDLPEFAATDVGSYAGNLNQEISAAEVQDSATGNRIVPNSEAAAFTWPRALLIAWLAGVLWQAVRLVQSARSASRLGASPALMSDPEVDDLNAWAAGQVGVRPVPLLQNAQIYGPIVCGIRHSKIVLPCALLTRDSRQQLRAALLHEYGHIRRHDLAFEVLLRLVTALFWPHPLVYVMARELRHLREEICDNFVLTRESPVAYSEMLLSLSLGGREVESGLIGLGMLSSKLRLEPRIASILNPSRSLDTRPGCWLRRSATALATLSLLFAIGVRFERASAEPREPAPPADAVQTSDSVLSGLLRPVSVSKGALQNEADRNVKEPEGPRTFRFQILSHDKKPVEGAAVTGWGIAAGNSGGMSFSENAWVKATTDGEGFVSVVATKELDAILTSRLGHTGTNGIRTVGLRIDHRDYPVRSGYFPVGKPVLLAEPITITARVRRDGETTPATELYPQVWRSFGTDFSEAGGVLTIRRVDLEGEPGTNWLRVVQVAAGEPAWFSDAVELRRRSGNSIDLDLVLKRGMSLEGRLGDMVPRGIRKGHVIAGVYTDHGQPLWNATAEIKPDGTFVLDSLPPDSDVQLIALCDGWVSLSPTQEEIRRYSERHGFPSLPVAEVGAGMVQPQFVRLFTPKSNVTIPMLRTASCEIKVVDEQGKPLPDVTVQFSPNMTFFGHGSMSLSPGRDYATWMRAQLAAKGRRDEPAPEKHDWTYTATTNADGLAVVTGLPAPEADSEQGRSAMFFVSRDGYTAISNFDAGSDLAELPVSVLTASLTAGRTERMTVRMLPASGNWPNPIGAGEPEAPKVAQPQAVLEGRVIDEAGQLLEGVEVLPGNEDQLRIRTDKNGRFRQVISDEPVSEEEMSEIPIRFVKAGFAPSWAGLHLGKRDQIVTLRKNTYFEGSVTRPNGQPAPNVKVRAWQTGRYSQNEPHGLYESWTETRTDDRGYYKLLVQPDLYVLVFGESSEEIAWHPRLDASDNRENRVADDGPKQRAMIAIDPNQASRVDAELEPGADFQIRFVNGLTGKPVLNVTVTPRDFPGLEQQTDAKGVATVPNLPAGDVRFSVHAEGFLRGSSETARRVAGAKQNGSKEFILNGDLTFAIKPGMVETVVTLEPAVEVSGRVLDPDGNGVPMASVSVISPPINATENPTPIARAYTFKDGNFTLWMPPTGDHSCHLVAHDRGSFLLTFASESNAEPGRQWANAVGPTLHAKAGEKLERIELRLSRAGQIQGRIVDDEGHPLAGVTIFSGAADGSEGSTDLPREVSDGEGRFVLTGVRPGRAQLQSSPSRPRKGTPRLSHQVVDVIADKTTDAGDLVVPTSRTRR